MLVMFLNGCALKPLDSPLPQGGPTIDEIMAAGGIVVGADIAAEAPRGALPDGAAGLHGYTRDAYREIENLFPLLPNPILIMYVFPHLSRSGAPIPGYSTAFPLYDKPHYALPGELN